MMKDGSWRPPSQISMQCIFNVPLIYVPYRGSNYGRLELICERRFFGNIQIRKMMAVKNFQRLYSEYSHDEFWQQSCKTFSHQRFLVCWQNAA